MLCGFILINPEYGDIFHFIYFPWGNNNAGELLKIIRIIIIPVLV